MLDSLKSTITDIASATAERILTLFTAKLSEFSFTLKPIYHEKEAAEFLGLEYEHLQKIRREKRINFIYYNPPKLKDETILDSSLIGKKAVRNPKISYFAESLYEFAIENEVLVKPRVFKRAKVLLEMERKGK